MSLTTHDEWLEYVGNCSQSLSTLAGRNEPRCVASGEVVLRYTDPVDGRERTMTADLLQVSWSGCMLRTSREIPITDVQLEPRTPGHVHCLRGWVRHSTSTIGGYKTGVILMFDDRAAR